MGSQDLTQRFMILALMLAIGGQKVVMGNAEQPVLLPSLLDARPGFIKREAPMRELADGQVFQAEMPEREKEFSVIHIEGITLQFTAIVTAIAA